MGSSYPSAEMGSVYSTAAADWTVVELWEVLRIISLLLLPGPLRPILLAPVRGLFMSPIDLMKNY